jgi:hypothetical protein
MEKHRKEKEEINKLDMNNITKQLEKKRKPSILPNQLPF